MDAIKAARELGKAIQADERYIRYNEARIANDNDEELQNLIGEFNLVRQKVALEMSKSAEEQSKEKLDENNKEMQRLYTLVMQNEHMADFTMAKTDMDKLLNEVNGIIALCCDGEDPDTCEVSMGGCTGSCSTCGGCH
ncbi:MAG: YlbF family regulator [Ruminiclostridium sp.]